MSTNPPHPSVLIIAPRRDTYSETFIHGLTEALHDEVTAWYGTPLPVVRQDGRMLYPPFPLPERLVHYSQDQLNGNVLHAWILALRAKLARFNVVLIHYLTAAALLGPALRRLRIPYVVHCHGQDVHAASSLELLGSRLRDAGRFSEAVVAVSETMRERLVELGVPPERIILRSYGIDLARFEAGNPSAQPPVFLAVGRMVAKKAPHLTLLAFAEVYRQRPAARLRWAGAGPLEGLARDLVQGLGLAEAVTFLGVLSHDEVAREMRHARAFVQHSVVPRLGLDRDDHEGTPVAILEASAAGLPVVSTRHAGIPEAVLDGVSGWLVPERDVSGMVAAMIRLIDEPAQAVTLGKAGREHIARNYKSEDYYRVIRETLAAARA